MIHFRKTISFSMLWSFLVLFGSGIILFIAPRGRFANWNDWTLMGLDKEQWILLHILFAIFFLVLSCFHIFLNRKALISYLYRKHQETRFRWREATLALLLTLVLIVLTVFSLPPTPQVEGLQERIKDHYERDVDTSFEPGRPEGRQRWRTH